MAKVYVMVRLLLIQVLWMSAITGHVLGAQTAAPSTSTAPPTSPAGVLPPAEYFIGPEDVLGVVFWREPEMSGDVIVRPDGRISLPVIGETVAAGLTPEALRIRILEAASKYLSDANVAVVVRTINSRKVYITGRVTTPGTHPLTGPLTVMQAIALAGGLTEYSDAKNITILRSEKGATRIFKFNYKDVAKGKGLGQNVLLQPGDTIVVP
jgi:polysaccharide export outer membrane protein